MNTLIALLLVATVVGGLLSALYHGAIRLTLNDAIRFKLFTLRDILRKKAILPGDKQIDANSFCYQHLEKKLNCLVRYTNWVTFGHVFEAIITDPKHFREITPEMARFKMEADDDLKAIDAEACRWMIISISVNSPGYSMLMLALYPLAIVVGIVLGKAKKCLDLFRRQIDTAVEANIAKGNPAFS